MRITSAQTPSVAEVMRTTRAKHFENPVDLTKDIERRDTYEKQNPSSRIGNISYDRNGVYLNLPENGKFEMGDGVSGEGELQKLHEGLREVRPITEEEARLLNFSFEFSGPYAKRIMSALNRVSSALNISGKDNTLEELFDMYDKQFGTDSKKELDEINQLRRVCSMMFSMQLALSNSFDNGKSGKDIMEYSDGSFSRADFDYVMGMANSFDYFGSRELTDKGTLITNDPNVNSDLKDIAMGVFGHA